MTIKNREQMLHAFEQLERLYIAIDSLKSDTANPQTFAVLAEGPVDMAQEILEEINQYVGVSELV